MEQGSTLSSPAHTCSTENHRQSTADESRGNPHCSLVATSTVVLHASSKCSRQSNITAATSPAYSEQREHPSSRPGVSPLDRVEDFPSLIEVIDKARKPATKLLYKYKWQSFLKFTEEHKLQPSPVALSTLLLYLRHLFDFGLSKSTLKVYTSAIIAFQPPNSESSR